MVDTVGYAQTVYIEDGLNIVEAGMFVVCIDKDTLRQWVQSGIPGQDATAITQAILDAYTGSGDP